MLYIKFGFILYICKVLSLHIMFLYYICNYMFYIIVFILLYVLVLYYIYIYKGKLSAVRVVISHLLGIPYMLVQDL